MFKNIFKNTFSALRHPNFRLWFGGQIISVIGTWMQTTAQAFLVYELTKSSAYLGLVGFLGGLPTLLFSLYGGIVVDRISKRKLIIITQSIMMVLAFILAALVFTGWVKPWHIIILAFLLGTANAFDAPARQAFVIEMVDRADLSNAIGLNSSIINLGVVIGPGVAGIIYAWLGPAWCFTINGISFIAVIAALALMKIQEAPKPTDKISPLVHLQEGFKFIKSEPRIIVLLVYAAILSIFAFSLITLIPPWAVEILGGDVRTNGLLLSVRGVGSLVGALMVANAATRIFQRKLWLAGWYVLPFALIAFALTRSTTASALILAVIGWCLMAGMVLTNTFIQSYVPDHLRGRVMSVYILVFMGAMPFGNLLAGYSASKFGEPAQVFFSAAVILLAALATFIFRKTIRQF